MTGALGAMAGTLIGYLSARHVAQKSHAFTKAEFDRQHAILRRIEAAKAKESDRQKELIRLRDLVVDAGSAVQQLISQVKYPSADIVKITADAFQSVGPLFKYASAVEQKTGFSMARSLNLP